VISWPVIVAVVGCLLISLAISAALTPLVRRWALTQGFVDRPRGEGHKEHSRPTAFGGGIAITAGILMPMLLALAVSRLILGGHVGGLGFLDNWAPLWPQWLGGVKEKSREALAIILGAIILHVLGLVDDHRPLSARFKSGVQFAVALLLTAWAGVRSAEALGPVASVILTTCWIVVLTNAFNFMDNMDGLSAGVAALAAVMLAVSALVAGQIFVPCLLMLVAGSALGFLIWNFPPASIFMGDAGSLVLGYMLAVCSVLTTFYEPRMGRTPFGVFVPLLVFAIPLYDMASVVIQRLRLGVSVFRGDRRHFSHRLVRRGLTPTAAVLTIYLATLATALPAILLPLHGWPVAILIFTQCLCVVAIIAILEACDGS
jgi:UDP-GlcNAc:undecaprenyl-phosphate/decaprenyl-phosphate GlcNAc-1-phosphate transferase